MKDKTKGPVPMDPSITEDKVGTPHTNQYRLCYALETLIEEVHALFPEVLAETSNVDGRNVAHDATYDLTALHDEGVDLVALLSVLSDERVADVTHDAEEEQITVSMQANPRIQDSRESFGLDAAYVILAEGNEEKADLDPEDVTDDEPEDEPEAGMDADHDGSEVDGGGSSEDSDVMDGGGSRG